jgi:hypothetical protein
METSEPLVSQDLAAIRKVSRRSTPQDGKLVQPDQTASPPWERA